MSLYDEIGLLLQVRIDHCASYLLTANKIASSLADLPNPPAGTVFSRSVQLETAVLPLLWKGVQCSSGIAMPVLACRSMLFVFLQKRNNFFYFKLWSCGL
ncbi:hypothetical protein SOV_29470 [Sporomusa ovata DSM 2662]|nr:hypothetical protein SOV_5c00510 [Sporomusa ovata DSM 2662]